jgi:acyl-homoserine-lactone acylase
MNKAVFTLVLACAACAPQDASQEIPHPAVAAWEQQAQGITIIRDDWGIPHIYGETDADAVFGMIYAQAEDDFNRIEVNFLNSQGRLAEAEGEAEIWRDLRMKLFIDPVDMRAQYNASPQWLRDLMDAWADGLNYYLYTHPEVTPRVITSFEPWMALTFSEGSIGGDIERVSLDELEAFYGDGVATQTASLDRDFETEPSGSNGFAIAPSNSASGNALLLINPHTSFFFRAELHMVSNEGLNAYGAVTWGQFFVYQGFNEGSGWMHTSSGVDNIDEYLETVVERDGSYFYTYGDEERPVTVQQITVPYRSGNGMEERQFTVYRTHHGPVVRQANGQWVSVSLMEEPLDALNQSYSRTKANNYEEFYQTMELHTNSSNNTVFADAEGNIAYFHANFIPRRNTSFDWSRPVDGSDPETEWQGVHSVDEAPNVLNPENGWIQNTNNWPYSAAGANSPVQADYPSYVQRRGENARGLHAIRVLDGKTDFDIQSVIDAAYDSYLTGFEDMIPALVRAYDRFPAASPLKARLSEQIVVLRDWDLRYTVESVPTSLAIFWGEELRRQVGGAGDGASAEQMIQSLATASDKLEADFGSWRTPWGDINRFQRLTGDIVQPFDDAGPSFPVEFASSRWGSLASFGARAYPQTKKWYGTSGNSFVAVVEFGDRVRARAITAGGLNSEPSSPHFNDQTERYATGNLRDVYYYREDLAGHIEREYHPGG